jgi:hypothetical protein
MKNLIVLILLIVLFLPTEASSQSGGSKMHQFRFAAGTLSGRYDDDSKTEFKNKWSSQQGVEVKGSRAAISLAYLEYDLEIESRTITPVDLDHWNSRSEMSFNFSYYYPGAIYVAPVIGYTQLAQEGDQTVESAPAAFIDDNNYMNLGARFHMTPYVYGDAHGFQVLGHYYYLTTYEKTQNFGTDSSFMAGYVFQESGWSFGIVGGQLMNYFNGTVEDPDEEGYFRHVRHRYITDFYGLYVQY